jgi:hypothetical protein
MDPGQRIDIAEVLGPRGRALVGDQIVQADHRTGDVTERRRLPAWPGTPMCRPTPGASSSGWVSPISGAPNSIKAAITRGAFVGVASTQMSRSPVARGRPCTATAYAPTTRYRASAAFNAESRSRTGFGFSDGPLLEAQLPRRLQASLGRHSKPGANIGLVGVVGPMEDPRGPCGSRGAPGDCAHAAVYHVYP